MPIVVKLLASGNINQPLVSVTVCVPGTNTCQTIDNVLLDTGSYGLRLFASALNSSMTLPAQRDPQGIPFWECTGFKSGYAWGPVVTADIKLGGETASDTPMQVIQDTDANLPGGCVSTGPVLSLGTNGILGVGVLAQDCGAYCAAVYYGGHYWSCASAAITCEEEGIALDKQVVNPVTKFTIDNNGVIIELPAIGDSGASVVKGLLVFGIGTQTNNQLGTATVLTADPTTGYISTQFEGNLFPSVLDTGSNITWVPIGSINLCSPEGGTYCPSAQVSLTATNTGVNQVASTVPFNIGNIDTLSGSGENAAFNNVAGQWSSTLFDFGLPFFYGRNVFLAISGAATSAGPGPYYAY